MTESARFLKWGTKIDARGVQLTMIVLLEKGKGPISVTIPNKTRKRVLDPPADVAKLAGTLKVGDPIRLSYDKLLSRRTYKSASVAGASRTGDSKPIVFEFGYLKKVRQGGKYHLSVVATMSGVSWIFLVPNADGGAAKAAALKPNPKAELARKLKKYRRGDTVHLKYEPYKYVFLLEDIEAARESGDGTVLSKRKAVRVGKAYQVVYLRLAKGGLVLYVPAPDAGADDAGGKGSEDLSAAVEELKGNQKVTFKYRREGGVYWLDEISPR